MRRVFVGFSTPVGYDYKNLARKTTSDISSSPNPVLVGSLGLLTLFDEIWFPCRSLCPDNMRDLSYVKFLTEYKPDCEFKIAASLREIKIPSPAYSIAQPLPSGTTFYPDFIENYYGSEQVDNHTHGISLFGEVFRGDPDAHNLILDLYLIDQFSELDLNLATNELTGSYLFPQSFGYLEDRDVRNEIDWAGEVLQLSNLYDITGPTGPYHPVIEELRNNSFIEAFRKWISGNTCRFDNRDAEQVLAELDELIIEFQDRSLVSSVEEGNLKHTMVDLAKGAALDLVPGAGTIHSALRALKATKYSSSRELKAFIASSRGRLWTEYSRSKRTQPSRLLNGRPKQLH